MFENSELTLIPSLQSQQDSSNTEQQLYSELIEYFSQTNLKINILSLDSVGEYFKSLKSHIQYYIYGVSSSAKAILKNAHLIDERSNYTLILAGLIVDFRFRFKHKPASVHLLYGEDDLVLTLTEEELNDITTNDIASLAQGPETYAPIQVSNFKNFSKVMPSCQIIEGQEHTLSTTGHLRSTILAIVKIVRLH